MPVQIERLISIAHELQQRATLEEQLQLLVERTAEILEVPRVNVRLLDPDVGRLMVKCRAGAPLHRGPFLEFRMGEGLIGWVAANGRSLLTGDAEKDPRFVVRPDMLEPLGSFLGVPLLAQDVCIGVLSVAEARHDRFTTDDEQWMTLLAALCAPHIEVARLSRLAQLDSLTGVLNRHGLDLAFAGALHDPSRPLSVAMCDIDRFKDVNDRDGHATGDLVLKRVALVLTSVLRAGDSVVRYGGEEFLLVLPGIEATKAARVAERARATIETEPLAALGSTHPVTISLGVAERHGAEVREQLIARADEALYRAKRMGRNQVCLAD